MLLFRFKNVSKGGQMCDGEYFVDRAIYRSLELNLEWIIKNMKKLSGYEYKPDVSEIEIIDFLKE